MKIDVQNYNDVAVLQMQGELDSDSVELLGNAIAGIIDARKTGIVLDMSDLEFIDSTGLGELLRTREMCSQNNCQLRLAGLNETLAKILEVTRLNKEFQCYAETAGAVKSLA
jgi:anti-sigma B factor antagonist